MNEVITLAPDKRDHFTLKFFVYFIHESGNVGQISDIIFLWFHLFCQLTIDAGEKFDH